MNSRSDLIKRIEAERARQFDLPGSENDVLNTPNDFIAIACRYLSEEVRRFGNLPNRDAYEIALVKAGAVILAALESAPAMQERGHFEGEASSDFFSKLKPPQ